MDSKDLEALELPKVLDAVAARAAFSASRELALCLLPTADLAQAEQRLAATGEARRLLSARPELSIGAAHDIRPRVHAASRGAVLEPGELLQVRDTLLSARELRRVFQREDQDLPELRALANGLLPAPEMEKAISRAISDRGEVLDSASPRLAEIRRQLRVARERLKSRLERLLTDPKVAPLLQEPIITQREGRFVVPLRAEYKGKLKSVVHDQSSSGATLFVEPLQVVEYNNRVRELELAEREEIRRVLAQLSARVGAEAAVLEATVVALAGLDLAFAKARYAEDLRAEQPRLTAVGPGRQAQTPSGPAADGESRGQADPSRMWLLSARHPLLDPEAVVPIDLALEPGVQALVITGPNTGGKTVALKTAGLLALMAGCGLHLPAAPGSQLALFRGVFADIGDEQSIEQSLSTFSAHISNIIRILGQADGSSLVLLDELGAGTDPQEGSALARALLGTLVERGTTALVATHFPELKAFAHLTPGVQNANVEFDLQNLRPTYRLSIGLPGRSNALAIAQRLGLAGEIVERARSELPAGELRADRLLDEIHRRREAAAESSAAAEAARKEVVSLRAELHARLRDIERERQQILHNARQGVEAELQQLAEGIRRLRRRLAAQGQALDQTEELEAEVEQLSAELSDLGSIGHELAEPESQADAWRIRPGELVHLLRLDAEGKVTALDAEEAEVQVGRLRIRARLDELGPPRAKSTTAVPPLPAHAATSIRLRPQAPSAELHLRGMTVEEALLEVEKRLEAAHSAGMPFLRIVHGKGTGRLREAIRAMLREHLYVAALEPGGPREGGEGVTVVHLEAD